MRRRPDKGALRFLPLPLGEGRGDGKDERAPRSGNGGQPARARTCAPRGRGEGRWGHTSGGEGFGAQPRLRKMPDWRMRVAGDAAVAVEFEARIDPVINARVLALAVEIRAARHPGVRDVVPSYNAVTVYFDPVRTEFDRLWVALEQAATVVVPSAGPAREVVVGVRYGGAAGPDLEEVAAFADCSIEEVVRRHTAPGYRVYMVGFLPGFPYLGTVDSRIAMPRRSSPRLTVPAGSVGIAGPQTGIYPTTAPGGWRLIGLASVEPFDAGREPPSLFRPGDTVRFEAISTETGR